MAALGGDTVVPTNWPGLIATAVIIAIVALATYMGLEYQLGGAEKAPEVEESLSVQEVFSANAQRQIAATEARASSRADFSAAADSAAADGDAYSDTSDTADDDWETPATDSSSTDDWDTSSSDWDTGSAALADSARSAATSAQSATTSASSTLASAASSAAATVAEKTQSVTAAASTAARSTSLSTSTPVAPRRPTAEALQAWWRDAAGTDQLSVKFAGPLDRGAKGGDGIAVMFSEAVSADQANQHMRLISETGQSISAPWTAGANPTVLLVDQALAKGRYELTIGDAIQGTSGKRLGKTLAGPVFVY